MTNSTASSTSTLTLAPASGMTATFAGIVQNGAGTVALTLNGSGSESLSGSNTYSGGTNLLAGTLQAGIGSTVSGGALANGPLGIGAVNLSGGTLQGAVTLANAVNISGNVTLAGLTFAPQTLTTPKLVTITAAPTIDVTAPVTINDAIAGGTLDMAGPLTMTITSTADAFSAAQVSGGTLVAAAAAIPAVPVTLANNASLTLNQTVAGTLTAAVGGSGSLTKLGGGVLVIGAALSYQGNTTVAGGTLQIAPVAP